MSDNDFPVMAGERFGLDLREAMGLRQGLKGSGVMELGKVMKKENFFPQTLLHSGSVLDVMAPENSGWLYDGTQPPETFGV